MMGRLKRDQGQFFYSFCLDDLFLPITVCARSPVCWTFLGYTRSSTAAHPHLRRAAHLC